MNILQSFMHRFFLTFHQVSAKCTHAHDVGALNGMTQVARRPFFCGTGILRAIETEPSAA